MKIALGSDHGGFNMKTAVIMDLKERGLEFEDLGCYNMESVDYPDYAKEVASRVITQKADEGILVCTTGIGMSMAANRFAGIRAALCLNARMAKSARTHNNANILVLAGGLTPVTDLKDILDEWFNNSFDNAPERHRRRVDKIDEL